MSQRNHMRLFGVLAIALIALTGCDQNSDSNKKAEQLDSEATVSNNTVDAPAAPDDKANVNASNVSKSVDVLKQEAQEAAACAAACAYTSISFAVFGNRENSEAFSKASQGWLRTAQTLARASGMPSDQVDAKFSSRAIDDIVRKEYQAYLLGKGHTNDEVMKALLKGGEISSSKLKADCNQTKFADMQNLSATNQNQPRNEDFYYIGSERQENGDYRLKFAWLNEPTVARQTLTMRKADLESDEIENNEALRVLEITKKEKTPVSINHQIVGNDDIFLNLAPGK